MQELERRLTDWTEEGLLSSEQAGRIAAFERRRGRSGTDQRADGPDDAPGDAPPPASRRVAVAEAVGYLGAVLALSAVGLIVGDLWPQLGTAGQLTLVGLLTVLAGAAGWAVHGQRAPAMRRLTGVLWAATAVGAAWFAGIVADEVLGTPTAVTAMTTGLVGAAVALPLLLRRPALPLHLVALAGLVTAAVGALDTNPLPPEVFYDGLLVAAIGGAWMLLGRGGWLAPRRLAEVLGGALALIGAQVASFGDLRVGALGLGLLLAAGWVVLAVQQDAPHLLVVGALGAFVLLPQLVVEVFGDAIGAPATLLVVGLLLVLLAVGLGRARREVRADAERGADR